MLAKEFFDARLSTIAKEHVPNGLENNKLDNDGEAIEKRMKRIVCFPKHAPTDCFCEKRRNAEEKKKSRNNNRHKLLQCNEDKEVNEEEKELESVEVEKEKQEKM